MSYNPAFTGNPSALSVGFLQSGYQNGSGGTLAAFTAVSTNTSGQILPTDITNEASSLAIVGLTTQSIPNTANGQIADSGRLQNVTTSFAIGDAIYVGLTPGTLTNVKPSVGVGGFTEGDFVIFIGVLVENEFDPSETDIKLMIAMIGEL